MGRTLFLLVLCSWIPLEVVGRKEPSSPTTVNSIVSSRPKVVKFGALFPVDSVIGRSALPAILAAVKDVNSSTSILPGIDLQVILHSTNCSAFLGTMEGICQRYLFHRLVLLKFNLNNLCMFKWSKDLL